MNIQEILESKRNGNSFDKESLATFLSAFKSGKVPLNLMMEFFTLLNKDFSSLECYNLANLLADSGERLNLRENIGYCFDKHSVGGVSDPTSLIYMSVLASLGQKVVKSTASSFTSFRNTLARFSVFDGFKANANLKQLVHCVNNCGAGVYENKKIAPLDKMLFDYAKDNNLEWGIPFIASSVMAKKLAVGATTLVVDVKCGEGALVASEAEANILAHTIVEIGKLSAVRVAVIITNLDQPVSASIGPRVEIDEVISILSYGASMQESNLLKLSKEMVVVSLMLAGLCQTRSRANEVFDESIESGRALEAFYKIVNTHGGKFSSFVRISDITSGYATSYYLAEDDGYVNDIDTYKINIAGLKLTGMGEKYRDDNAGLVLLAREGDKVQEGGKLVRIFYSFDNPNLPATLKLIKQSIEIKKTKKENHAFFYRVVI